MPSLNRLLRGLRHPGLVASILNKQFHTRFGNHNYNQIGVDVFAEDFDNLIILDACRFDEFVRETDFPGRTQWKTSRGSASKEFIIGNFSNRDLRDTVYISSNGWYSKLQEDLNCELYKYEFTKRDAYDGLTSSPETVTNAALEAVTKYPNKRLVAHYMQPHRPYIGEKGKRMFDGRQPFVDMMAETNATNADLRESYRENLRIVAKSVNTLLDELEGKTIITADHGELLGERELPIPIRHYGHPEGVYVSTLTKVPWHVIESDTRRHITKGEPLESDDYSGVEQNLRDLGYLGPS